MVQEYVAIKISLLTQYMLAICILRLVSEMFRARMLKPLRFPDPFPFLFLHVDMYVKPATVSSTHELTPVADFIESFLIVYVPF